MSGNDGYRCSACGRQLVFRMGPNGKNIPLERVANVYVIDSKTCTPISKIPTLGEGVYFVSHYISCPHPEEFRKRDRTGEPA